jgi:hypothetical protein
MRFTCQTSSLLGGFEQNNNSGNCTPLVGGTRFWIFQVTFCGPIEAPKASWGAIGSVREI